MSEGIKSYWINIKTATKTLRKGLQITGKHMLDAREQRKPIGPSDENYFESQNGLFTLQYPRETIPVPDHGRYKLHNEIDDCIVCDKCAKICPVNCIDIEPVRAVEEYGKTSDGTPLRIHAAKFDIDMAKCCFCGLCTTVCPTECLTMTSEYDFSAFDFEEHTVPFANMTPLEILQKKKAFEEYSEQKTADKVKAAAATTGTKPAMKPSIPGATGAKPKIVIKPKIQVKKEGSETAARPVIKPKIQVKKENEATGTPKVKPIMKPKVPMRPQVPTQKKEKPEEGE